MLGWLEWRWLGGIYIPNHQTTVGEGLLSMDALDSSVCQPHHPTVRVLTQSIVGALTSDGTRQSGVAPDRYCALSGALLAAALTFVHTVALQASVAVDCSAGSRCSAWCTGQSGGTPDSLVNYSGVDLEKPEGEEFGLVRSWCTRHCLVAHRTVWCATPGYSSVSFAPFF
jgi:hypothetical protein